LTPTRQLITSGDYTAVLKSWGVAMGAVKEVSVNETPASAGE
jgi:hypothetical protein